MPAPAWLRRQLSGPHGWLARPMARLLNQGNKADYVRAVHRLKVTRSDHVLELGFGGGVGLALLTRRGCLVTGVEPAVAMRARAIRRHAWDLAEGRLTIVDARAEALPDGPFTHAISMNTAYFWEDVPKAMSELRRVVSRTVVLGIATTEHLEDVGFRESGFRVEPPEWYGEQLGAAGFDVAIDPAPRTAGCALLVGTPR